MKIIAIYPGRFQPFGPHHAQAFKWLQQQFGTSNTYIVTSDKVEPLKSPLNFEEKRVMMIRAGVPSSQIVKVKNPYRSEELTKKFDPDSTALVFMYGEKDAGRLSYTKKDGSPGYFQKYPGKDKLEPLSKHGYVVVAPNVSIDIPGFGEMSGTKLRQFIPQSSPQEFKKLFGWYDEKIHQFLAQKFGALTEASRIAGNQAVDDGPRFFYGDVESYKSSVNDPAKKPYEWEVANWILGDITTLEKFATEWPNGPVPTVSFFPTGVPGDDNQGTSYYKDLKGHPAFKAWIQFAKKLANRDGFYITDELGANYAINEMAISESTMFNNWKRSSKADLAKEFKIEYLMKSIRKRGYFNDVSEFIDAYNKGSVETITHSEDKHIRNRSRTNTKRELLSLIKTYASYPEFRNEESLEKLYQAFLENKPMTMPIIIDDNGTRTIFSGNTRMDVAFQTGINPQVVVIKVNSNSQTEQTIQEAKQVGDIYHFTRIRSFIKILKEDFLKASSMSNAMKLLRLPWYYGISTTRAANFNQRSKGRAIGGIEIRLKLDGDKMSNQYQSTAWDDTTAGRYVYKSRRAEYGDEMEELWYGKKIERQHGIKNISKYIKAIDFTKEGMDVLRTNAIVQDLLADMMADKDMGIRLKTSSTVPMHNWTQAHKEKFLMLFFETLPELIQAWLPGVEVTYQGKPAESYKYKPRVGEKEMAAIEESVMLTEGGAFGHMAHPFDDTELTFKDLSELIERALGGHLGIEGGVQEKTDGQNLMVTYQNGKVKAARNKSTIKAPMDIDAVASKFAGRGDLEQAFVGAMKDLESALHKIGDDKLNVIFKNGMRFLNIEIIYPGTKNVIDYGQDAYLVFLGMVEFDESGKMVRNMPKEASRLQSIIDKINASQQDTFSIIAPKILDIAKDADFDEKVPYFKRKLAQIISDAGIRANSTIGDYYESKFRKRINEVFPDIPDNVKEQFIQRWVYGDKSVTMTKSYLGDIYPKFKEYETSQLKDDFKEFQWPLESIFLELGVEVMSNITDFLASSPDKTIQSIRASLANLIKQVRGSKDPSVLKAFRANLEKIKQLGGFDKIIPAEGIVFNFKGRLMKLTGTFAPINQLLGLFRYSR